MYPERNGCVQVYAFSDVKVDGVLHNGFLIIMEGDIRDMAANKYRAKLDERNSNEIVIEAPTMSYVMLHEADKRFAQLGRMKIDCPRCHEAQEVVRNDI